MKPLLPLHSVSCARFLWTVDLRPLQQADGASVEESHGLGEPEDAGADRRPDRPLGGSAGPFLKLHEALITVFTILGFLF